MSLELLSPKDQDHAVPGKECAMVNKNIIKFLTILNIFFFLIGCLLGYYKYVTVLKVLKRSC